MESKFKEYEKLSGMKDIKVIEGIQFLELIENLYNEEGMSSIISLVEREFSIGTLVDLKQGISDNKIFRICNRAVWKMDSLGNLTNSALLPPLEVDSDSCGIIRVFALSYVSDPFQIELYGEETT